MTKKCLWYKKRGQKFYGFPQLAPIQHINHNVKGHDTPAPYSPALYPHEKSITTIKSIARNHVIPKSTWKKHNKMAKKETVQ